MKSLVLLSALVSLSAHAASVPPMYLVGGRATDAESAIIAAAKGASVLQCKPVELKVSKSGTSIALKTKKKSSN